MFATRPSSKINHQQFTKITVTSLPIKSQLSVKNGINDSDDLFMNLMIQGKFVFDLKVSCC